MTERKSGKDASYWTYLIWQMLTAGIKVTGEDGAVLPVGDVSGALITIAFPHYMVHQNKHFMYTDSVTLNAAGTQDYLLVVPATPHVHVVFHMDGSAITQWQFYEGSTHNGTTLQTVSNNNRNSAAAAALAVYKGATDGADGVLIYQYKGGSATNQARASGATGNNEELILKASTKYLLRVTSGTASNLTNLRLEWYEHD